MSITVRRKGAVGTMAEAAGWLRRSPVLVALFFAFGILAGVGQFFVWILLPILLVRVYVEGIVHLYGRDFAAGTEPDVGDASSTVLSRMVSLIGVYIVWGVLTVVGFVFLIVPGIYVGLRLSLAVPACVIDDQGVRESLETSWTVAPGNLLKLFAVHAVGAGPIAASSFLVPFLTGSTLVVAILITATMVAVLSPILVLSLARIYLENTRESGSDGASWARDRDDSWAGGSESRTA